MTAQFGAFELVLVALSLVMLSFVLLRTSRRGRTRMTRAKDKSVDVTARARVERRTIREIDQVMIELEELSRQIHGRIDTKLVRLEVLTMNADRRIAELTRLTKAPSSESSLDVTLEEERPPDTTPPIVQGGDSLHDSVGRLAGSGLSPRDIAKKLKSTVGEVELVLSLRRVRDQAGAVQTSVSAVPNSEN